MNSVTTSRAIDPYVRPRAGLGDLPARLRTEHCTIAYLGASVTAQRDGYRPRLHGLLEQATGRDHRAVSAGTGAMGSITGVFLMDELVLAHHPDLCFVEYTTSDASGTTPLEHVGPALEGIVCKLGDAACRACFLHLHRTDHDASVGSLVADTYERVADHYEVPSIDVGLFLRELTGSGEITTSAVLRDVVHTTALGSDLTAQAVAHGLEHISAVPGRAAGDPAPLHPESFRRTRIVPATPALLRDGARYRDGRFRLVYPYLEIDSGNELSFAPGGDLVGLLVILGPDSGYVEVESADGAAEYLLWDEHCSYERLGSVVFTPFARVGEPVTIRLGERAVDYSSARRPVDPAASIDKRLKVVGLMERL